MNSKLEERAKEIVDRFQSSWSLTWDDLKKPEAEQLLFALMEPEEQASTDRMHNEFFGAGPLESYLNDESITEIIVNGPKELWCERQGRFQPIADYFLTELTFQRFIDRLCTEAGIKVDLAAPFANGRWRGFRCHLAMAPLSHCSIHMAFRRSSSEQWDLAKLGEVDWASESELKFLADIVAQRKNALVVGPTGSGKTTVLGAMLKGISQNERAVILEDTDELPRPNAASTKLLARPELGSGLAEINLHELVKQSLRMRPERLVVGEVRGSEAKDLMLALATGHQGSLGTLHGADARQALLRLEMLIQMGAPQWSLQSVRQLLSLSLEVLVVCGMKNGHRRLQGIYRVAALESCGILLEPML